MSQNNTLEHSNDKLALNIARRAMKIVIFIGMFAVVLLMINIYILLNQITATAQISREIKVIKQALDIQDSSLDSLDSNNKVDSNSQSKLESSTMFIRIV